MSKVFFPKDTPAQRILTSFLPSSHPSNVRYDFSFFKAWQFSQVQEVQRTYREGLQQNTTRQIRLGYCHG